MADEKKTTGYEEQAPPSGPGGSKAPPVPQAEQQPVQLGIENLDAPASDKKAEKSGPDHAIPLLSMNLAKGSERLTVDWFGALVMSSGIRFHLYRLVFCPNSGQIVGRLYGMAYSFHGRGVTVSGSNAIIQYIKQNTEKDRIESQSNSEVLAF